MKTHFNLIIHLYYHRVIKVQNIGERTTVSLSQRAPVYEIFVNTNQNCKTLTLGHTKKKGKQVPEQKNPQISCP